jgi:hypothetical protein
LESTSVKVIDGEVLARPRARVGGTVSALPAVGAVALITLAGLLLRLPSYGNSLFGDELSTYFIVTQHSLTGIVRLLDGHSVDLNPPFFFLLSRAVHQLGSSPQLLRLVSLVAGTAAIPITYALGLRTVGRRAALAGAALMALSPYLIFYSTEARAYALVMLLALASTYCLLLAAERGGTRWWIGYAATSCAAMYTHYTAAFVLVVQLIWAFLRYPGARRALLGANLAAGLGFIPWLPALIDNSHSFGTRVFELLEPFGLHAVVSDLAHSSVGHPFLALSTVPGTIGTVLVVAGTLAGVVAAFVDRGFFKRPTAALCSPTALPLLLALATPVGLALYSALATDIWDMRNLISSWPGFALAAGAVLTSPATRVRFLTVGLVIAGCAIGAVQLLSAAHERPDYTAAADFIIADGPPTDPVAIVPAPTPGPLAAMDAALAYAGEPGRPLLRIGSATLQAVLRAPRYTFLPPTPAAVLAGQAARIAPGAKLFVVAPGNVPLAVLLRSGPIDVRAALGPIFGSGTTGRLFATLFGPLSEFLRATLPRFRPLDTRTFPGVLRLSVYVLERR